MSVWIKWFALQEAWSNGKKEGLEKLIKEKLTAAEEKKIEDLLIVLESHFDPDKEPKLRISGDRNQIKLENSNINDDKENNNKCDSGTESPDTTTSNSPLKIKSESSENSTIIAEE